MHHGLAVAATMAYFIYLECCEGSLDESWKNDEPMTMKRFRRRLSKQMCEYKSYREEYPGDEYLHTTTIRTKKRCGTKRKVSEAQNRTTEYEGGVTYEPYVDQVGYVTPGVPKRFCNDAVGSYMSHFHSGVCDKALHWSDPLDKNVK
jgi:hypothetical protein